MQGLYLTRDQVTKLESIASRSQVGGKQKRKQRGGVIEAVLVGLGLGLAHLCGSTTTHDDDPRGERRGPTQEEREEFNEHMNSVSREMNQRAADNMEGQLRRLGYDRNGNRIRDKKIEQPPASGVYGGGVNSSEKKYIMYNSRKYVVRKDGRKSYISSKSVRVYLSEIRGKYERL